MAFEKKDSISRKWEYIVPLLAIMSLLISCIVISQRKYFWNDELLSFYLLNDQSFRHMIIALTDKINNAPPLYFTLGWIWAKLFGSTELSLRLFSSLSICAALSITWITLRRTYNFWSVSIAILGVFCFSEIILYQNTEARFYGLFLAVCSLGIFHYDSICRRERCPPTLILAGAFVHALIIQTHVFGFLYSGAILLALIIRDSYLKDLRPKIYLSVVTGWLSFVPWIGPFLNQADLGKPRSWIPVPTIDVLINSLTLRREVFLILLAIGMVILVKNTLEFPRNGQNRTQSFEKSEGRFKNSIVESSLLLLAYCFLAVPVLVWVISRTLEPIFINRYMIATQLSWTILLASLIARTLTIKTFGELRGIRAFINGRRLVLIMLILILPLAPIYAAIKFHRYELPGAYDDRYGYSELPIIVEFSHQFLQRFQYSPKRNRYFFILDWEAALDKGSGLFSPGEYKTMDALRRNYPVLFRDNIVQSQEFLRMHRSFLVLNYDDNCTPSEVACPKWFEVRIRNNPKYKRKKIGTVDGMDLLLVETKE